MVQSLTTYQRRQLALEARAHERTVVRAYRDPNQVRESTLLRLRDVAQRLGFPLPPAATTISSAAAALAKTEETT